MTNLLEKVFIEQHGDDIFLTPEEESRLVRTYQHAQDDRDKRQALEDLAIAFAPALVYAARNHLYALDIHHYAVSSLPEITGPLFEGFFDLIADVDPDERKPISRRVYNHLDDTMGQHRLNRLDIKIPWGSYKRFNQIRKSYNDRDWPEEAVGMTEDTYRQVKNALNGTSLHDDEDSEVQTIRGDDLFTRIDDRILAEAALGVLSEGQAAVMAKLYGEAKSVREVAAELGIAAATVQKRRVTALERMRVFFGVREEEQ